MRATIAREYRIAYDQFFAKATDPAAAIAGFRERLLEHAAEASFMKSPPDTRRR